MSESEVGESPAARQIAIDIACPNLIPGHRLQVPHLAYDPGDVLRLRYIITPTLPTQDASTYPSPIHCWWEATDNLGTRYQGAGGAFGPSPDRQRTEGVFSLMPVPPTEARELRVTIQMGSPGPTSECAFTIDLTGAASARR